MGEAAPRIQNTHPPVSLPFSDQTSLNVNRVSVPDSHVVHRYFSTTSRYPSSGRLSDIIFTQARVTFTGSSNQKKPRSRQLGIEIAPLHVGVSSNRPDIVKISSLNYFGWEPPSHRLLKFCDQQTASVLANDCVGVLFVDMNTVRARRVVVAPVDPKRIAPENPVRKQSSNYVEADPADPAKTSERINRPMKNRNAKQ